ncbi:MULTISPECIES: glycoside hydrolase family 78 protein [unclassified Microbacterium]|uniref:glycoside hydrolase family 78 protein n=1 Tax=Microbacterium TaxID=33882 RepID=UPI003BA27024
MTQVASVRFEHRDEALGIGEACPRLSWHTTAAAGWAQRAYEVEVARGGESRRFAVESAESVLVPWPDDPLSSREEARVRIRVAGDDGAWSGWSEPAVVEAGLLDPLDWIGAGVQAPWDDPAGGERRPPLFRRGFTLSSGVRRARLYATAHGVYELEVNGRRVGADELNPGWTVYPARLRYHTYDVTDLLRAGENAVGAWMGDGWWRGRLGFDGGQADLYGADLALLAQLEVELEDGSRVTISTDAEWRAHRSPILRSSLYLGETFDVREVPRGWSEPGFDDAAWEPVRAAHVAHGTLVAPEGPPVRCTEDLTPVSIERRADGRIVIDFGQNFAGRLRVRASSGVGPELTIRHAEVLQDDALYTRTLRGAISEDRYLGSDGSIDWEPRFTIHGFRYAEIAGYDGPLDDLAVTGRVLHTAMRRTGWLETSDPSLDRLHDNVLWSLRSNFVDIPTDCPQRDERLGWTGDIQVFAATATYLYDCAGFLSSWLRDLEVEQRRVGTVPVYVPFIPGGFWWTPGRPIAAWGDAAALTPWDLWRRYADRELVLRQLESARAWVDQVAGRAGATRLWNADRQLGDWLDPTAPPEDPAAAQTDPALVATAFFAHSARRVGELAAAVGQAAVAEQYESLAAEVRAAIRGEWFDADGRLAHPTQTGYALAIAFELLDERMARVAGAELARLVREGGFRVGAGFAGVNLVADALTATGHADDAFAMLTERSTPSWLSMVDKGATTIWERWDSLLDDGTVNPGEMTSFNHYALGSIADWMHREIGGIATKAPGSRTVRIAPRPGGGLTWARARHASPYGEIAVAWSVDGGRFTLDVSVPVGVTAEVVLPSGATSTVSHGTHHFEDPGPGR